LGDVAVGFAGARDGFAMMEVDRDGPESDDERARGRIEFITQVSALQFRLYGYDVILTSK
jgi:hypothetical protein